MNELQDNAVLERPGPVRLSLKAKTYLSRLAWLNAPLRWEAHRVVRIVPAPGGEGTTVFTPTVTDIAQAEYCRNRVTALLRGAVARRETDTPQQITEALRLAKRLFALRPIPDALSSREIPLLIEWLIPEALAENNPALSPSSRLLVAAQQEAIRPIVIAGLEAFLADSEIPQSAHLLAASLLGMLSRKGEAGQAMPLALSPTCRRAFRWGQQHPQQRDIPLALLTRFLDGDEGEAWAGQVVFALSARRDASPLVARLLPDSEALWGLLTAGYSPRQVAELASVMASDAFLLAERLLRRRYHANELPEQQPRLKNREQRREVAERVRAERTALFLGLADQRWKLVAESPEPATTCALVDAFIHRALSAWQVPASVWESVLIVPLAELSRLLPPNLYPAALGLLTETYATFYPAEEFHEENLSYHAASASDWFRQRKNVQVIPLFQLLGDTEDTELAREAIQRRLLHLLYAKEANSWQDPSLIRYIVYCAQYLDIVNVPPGRHNRGQRHSRGLRHLVRVLRAHYTSGQEARAEFTPVLRTLHSLNPTLKLHLLEVWIRAINDCAGSSEASRNRLRRMAPYFLILAEFAAARDEEQHCFCESLAKSLTALVETCAEQVPSLLNRLIDFLKDKEVEEHYWLAEGVQIAATLSPENPERFIAIVQTFSNDITVLREFQDPALSALRAYPRLRAPFAARITEEPHRCLRLLGQLGRLWQRVEQAKLSEDAHPLQSWEVSTVDSDRVGMVMAEADDWQQLRELIPDLAPTMADYWHACWICGDSLEVPKGVQEILQLPERLARELDYLETWISKGSPAGWMIARRDSLRNQLADTEGLHRRVAEEMRERLTNITALRQLDAVEQTLQESILAELRCLVGPGVPLPRYVDDDLLNAIEIGSHITHNQKLLVKLLRAYLRGEATPFIEQHPKNRRFRQWAVAQGIAVDCWLGERSEVVTLPNGQAVRLYLETEPLRILQMGTLFDTCLSSDGINAYSTVANACDQNKRVLYGCDALTGRILARKLIAITETGTLVGFHTYTRQEVFEGNDAERNTAITALLSATDAFLLDFAEQCHLPTDSYGNILTLLSEQWYDDGQQPWQREESGTLTPCEPLLPEPPALLGRDSVSCSLRRDTLLSLSRGMPTGRAKHWATV